MTCLIDACESIAQLGVNMMGEYSAMRARLLKLDAAQTVAFRQIACDRFLQGEQYETALQNAAKEIGK